MKVCLFNLPGPAIRIGGFDIESFDPMTFFSRRERFSYRELIVGGLDRFYKQRAMIRAESVDQLYRERDPSYMRLIGEFVERFRSFDILVMRDFNFLHPEILRRDFGDCTKILGFVDDPHSTYIRGIPYLWAFDGAFYISPAYDQHLLFNEALRAWGCSQSYWWPLAQKFDLPERSADYFQDRTLEVAYVGNPTLGKLDRLIELKAHFRHRFRVHGRWRARGYYGLLRGLTGKSFYWGRVASLTAEQKSALYRSTRIGFNMHVSDTPAETGNMRMYEVPAHGMMQICDKAALGAHSRIFEPDVEAIYYDSIPDAIDKIEYFLAHEEERIRVAMAGYERMRRSYSWETNLIHFLEWASKVKRRSETGVGAPWAS